MWKMLLCALFGLTASLYGTGPQMADVEEFSDTDEEEDDDDDDVIFVEEDEDEEEEENSSEEEEQ